MNTGKHSRLSLALLLPALFLAASCGRKPAQPVSTLPAAETCSVERGDIVEYCHEEGAIEAARSLSLHPEIPAPRLKQIHVRSGDLVKRGDRLFTLDSTEIDASLAVARASHHAISLQLKDMRQYGAQAREAEAQQRVILAKQAQGDATRSLDIQAQLLKEGLGSITELERVRSASQAAELALKQAEVGLKSVQKPANMPDLARLEATLAKEEANVTRLEKQKEHCLVTAPFDGHIVKMNERVTRLDLKPNDPFSPFPLGPGQLATVADTQTMRVTAGFFERDIPRIRIGQKAQVKAAHAPGRDFEGIVTYIGQSGVTYGRMTTVLVEVTVDNREYLLKPGLSAHIQITVGESENTLIIPTHFVRGSGADTHVWVKPRRGAPRKTPIETGLSNGHIIEILSGVNENDVLVME